MIYQIIPRKDYSFQAEKMQNFLKSLSAPTGKRKGFFKRLLEDYPYTFVIDCNHKGILSLYLKCDSDENNSQSFLSAIETLLGGEASALPIYANFPVYARTSTLYLPYSSNINEKKSEQQLTLFFNESIFMTIIQTLSADTRIWLDFKVKRGSKPNKKQSFMRQGSDVELEYILKVQGKTKFHNTKIRDISAKIASLTAFEKQYYIDYKDSYRESVSSGLEVMNILQIPTLKGKSTEELKRIYHLYQGQVTLDIDEFDQGFYVGKLCHPVQDNRAVYLDETTARKHVFIGGTTGSGKTSVFEEVARGILLRKLKGEKNVPGFTLFDPKEGAVLGVIDILLKYQSDGYDITSVLDKVRVVDFSCKDYVFPISLLNSHSEPSMILDFFKSLYGDMKTPQVDRTMGDAMQALMMDPKEEHTIGDLAKVFDSSNDTYRIDLANRLKKDMYAQDIVKFLKNTKMSNDKVDPVLNRISMFNNTEQKKLMFGLTSKYDSIKDIRKWMDAGYIILFNLAGMSKFEINVICGYLSLQYYLTCLKRPSMALLHLLFVDEAHDVQLPIFHKIGAKGREQGLAIVPMTQFVEQFDNDYRKDLFGNINTFISLRHTPEAANNLVKMIPGGKVTPNDMEILKDRIGYLTAEDHGKIKTVLIEASAPYRYTDGILVNYKDPPAMEKNKEKNRAFARELMARDCLSKEEAEKIVFKNYFAKKEKDEYEKELLSEGDSMLSVEEGDKIIWED
ncbi:hypothetical protein M2475_001609 [Breznakia sp. PF5-3]|uniref:hypothetical protein n=1 Tax=unclassified Breznakia TaxID=2623764 RepID=UPI0024060603|nr:MULTISPECIES: hypothetical protein [unclassified Breznakia]MDF9825175.1 hypothetical protein [Breznakia sp. PM6-1]MDF9836033.1 hypothetical protein [Breznakia sp. PF5-3]MDF9838606.1 hypothetical protein [Breznakia sp. PFB2-8]MDF9860625.1 hypothetical protein [Breznakia sp. PH5-24]